MQNDAEISNVDSVQNAVIDTFAGAGEHDDRASKTTELPRTDNLDSGHLTPEPVGLSAL